jgi:hypothetical protein
VFACAVSGAATGMFLQRVLPPSHLGQESKDVIKLGTGLIATMAALILGLLVGTAKSNFDSQTTGFQQLATDIILLDRQLAHYGPEAKSAREQLRGAVESMIERLWPADGSHSAGLRDRAITAGGATIYDAIRNLSPSDDFHRSQQNQALQIGADLARNRWRLSYPDDGSLPIPFLVVLAFWLFVLFASFGLFAPQNGTVIAVLIVCALSVAGAVFLIVDLDQPFEGLLQVSSASLRNALAQLGQ